MELLRNNKNKADLRDIYADILDSAKETEYFGDAVVRKQDKKWALELDVTSCLEADIYECYSVLEAFVKRGLFLCYGKLLNALRGKIPCEKWAELIAKDIRIDTDEANQLAAFVYRKSNKKLLVFYEDVWLLGGIERVVTVLLNGLKDEYRLLLLTSKEAEETKEIQEKVID